jgi:hypothetical protein
VIIASVHDGVANVSDLRAQSQRNARAASAVRSTEGS